ncbi:C6 and C2H2 transcription factor [Aspergillus karnatakaensis]|uniref:Zn(II)2Cys6 transcription factor domain-containing protein n=1 Tax=Aspergillus karnatakaensis TaxID=1810916 RepID=UPI003CCCBC46
MVTETPADSSQSLFQCTYPGCGARYQRKGHRNRHMAQHSQQDRLSCPYCESTVTRNDLLRRHVRIYHPQEDPYPSRRAQRACASCHKKKERCDGGFPCNACRRKGIACSSAETNAPVERDTTEAAASNKSPAAIYFERNTQRYIDIYFKEFHPAWPFLYCSTFDLSTEPTVLVQSMVMLALWIKGDGDQKTAAVGLHERLCSVIYDQMDQWYIAEPSITWPMGTYQSILLQVIFALFQAKDNASFDLSLRFRLSPLPYRLLVALVQSCRRLEIFTYPKMLERHGPAAPISLMWVTLEEVKRFGLALYKACRMCCPEPVKGNAGDPRDELLTLGELNFCMPDSDEIWNAPDDTASIDLSHISQRTKVRDNGDPSGWVSHSWSVLHSAHFKFDWL